MIEATAAQRPVHACAIDSVLLMRSVIATCEALEVALYHTLGDLPEPELTHRFC